MANRKTVVIFLGDPKMESRPPPCAKMWTPPTSTAFQIGTWLPTAITPHQLLQTRNAGLELTKLAGTILQEPKPAAPRATAARSAAGPDKLSPDFPASTAPEAIAKFSRTSPATTPRTLRSLICRRCCPLWVWCQCLTALLFQLVHFILHFITYSALCSCS